MKARAFRLGPAIASPDATVRLWDVATGQESIALKGHTDFVLFVAFSDDDKILTSGSRDQTIRFWRAATKEEAAAQDKSKISFQGKRIG